MEIGKKLCYLLLQPYDDINLKLPLGDLGLDSLVALELRVWWKQVFAFDVTSFGNVGMASLLALGQHVANRMECWRSRQRRPLHESNDNHAT